MTMRSRSDLDLDIDIDGELLVELNEFERAATSNREHAAALRKTAKSWRNSGDSYGRPGDAEVFARMNDAKACDRSRNELAALVALDEVLLRSGSSPGDEWQINDSLYRVVTRGNPCVRLGSVIPKDEPDSDPEWSDRDEQRERMTQWAEMVRVGQL